MDSRRYTLNRKCFAATRALHRGVPAPHWDVMHVTPQGVFCTDTRTIIRVTLPEQVEAPTQPQVFDRPMFESFFPSSGQFPVVLPPSAAKHGAMTPNFSQAIPGPEKQIASVTLNAASLIDALKACCDVSEHKKHMVRLRICSTNQTGVTQLRIDAHRGKGEQEITVATIGMTYDGIGIPGDAPKGAESNFGGPQSVNEAVIEPKLLLPMVAGRKFRD